MDWMPHLHVEEAEALAVQQQCEHNEGECDISAQYAQRGNADEISEEGLFAH